MQHNVDHSVLENGISLVVIPLTNTVAVTTIVLMGVGSRYESDHQQGLAHFTEHMVFKGGIKYPTAQQIVQALDAVGGEFNAFTSQEFTGFYTKTAARHMELGVDVLSDMVLHATIPEVELEKEKGVIAEEINMYEDVPMRKVEQVLNRFVYGDTPIGRPIIGTKETTASFKREDFEAYRKMFYHGRQCVIVIAGAVEPAAARELVTRYFKEMPASDPYQPEPARFQPSERRVCIEEKASEQTHLMLACEGYALDHPDRYAYRLLSVILGGNMSSRLFSSVREQQGLCYYVRAVPDTYVDTGLLIASAGVDNFRLNLAVAAIMHELRLMRDERVTPQELERAKQFLLGKMLLGLEDSEQVAEFYGMQELMEKKIESPESIEKKVLAVTAEEIQKVARHIFVDEKLRLAIIGPQKDVDGLERLLHFT